MNPNPQLLLHSESQQYANDDLPNSQQNRVVLSLFKVGNRQGFSNTCRHVWDIDRATVSLEDS